MNPIRTEYSNVTYVAEGCRDLPATVLKNSETGQDEVETVWELTDEEIEQIRKSRRIYLYIMGRAVPPVLLTSESFAPALQSLSSL